MKRFTTTKVAIMLFSLLQLYGCKSNCTQCTDSMLGTWYSLVGKSTITINKDGDKYTATVYHKTSNGLLCPITYPIIQKQHMLYIQAEGRILLTRGNNHSLFLSPGGQYKQTQYDYE